MTESLIPLSDRTIHWFGDKTRDELLAEIDRIITTDKPALAKLYERLDDYETILVELRGGYEDFYSSGDNARLLNVESQLRALQPPLRDA